MMQRKLFITVLIFILYTNVNFCKAKPKSVFAPGTLSSIVLSIFLGLQNKPSFEPAPGNFTESVTVKIANSKNNPNLPIHYTIDGSRASCSSTKYDSSKGVVLDTGKIYTLNAVECFEGQASQIGSAEYIVGFCQNYSGAIDGRLIFIRNQFGSYSPISTTDTYEYTISPEPNSCLKFEKTATISGTCPNTIAEQEYRITRVLQSGTGENQTCLAKIGVYIWQNEAYLKAPNSDVNDEFGWSVAISGDTIVVGSYKESSNQTTITNGTTSAGNGATTSGAAYVFRRTGTTWSNEAYLKAPNAEAFDQFGGNVFISGDTIIVSANKEDSSQTTITNGTLISSNNLASDSGAVYVFRRNGTIWTNEAYLKAPNAEGGVPGDELGLTIVGSNINKSISISEDTIIVGAINEDSFQTTITNGTLISSNNLATDSGAVYVFRRNGNIWTNEAYLKAPNAEVADAFGISVSISGDTIVSTASAESSNQTTITNGTTTAGNGSPSTGAIYVFKRTGTTWINEAYIKAPNAESSDNFGNSLSISGDTIVAGAWGEDSSQTTITNGTLISSNNLATDSGAVYVFRRNGNIWTNEAYLKAPNADASDRFGWSASISNETIIVGANAEASNQTTITNGIANANNGFTNAGAVYVFRRVGITWTNEAYLKAPNTEGFDQFGFSVSISGDTIVVGATQEDSNQTTITNGTTASVDNSASNSGAAYVFRLK